MKAKGNCASHNLSCATDISGRLRQNSWCTQPGDLQQLSLFLITINKTASDTPTPLPQHAHHQRYLKKPDYRTPLRLVSSVQVRGLDMDPYKCPHAAMSRCTLAPTCIHTSQQLKYNGPALTAMLHAALLSACRVSNSAQLINGSILRPTFAHVTVRHHQYLRSRQPQPLPIPPAHHTPSNELKPRQHARISSSTGVLRPALHDILQQIEHLPPRDMRCVANSPHQPPPAAPVLVLDTSVPDSRAAVQNDCQLWRLLAFILGPTTGLTTRHLFLGPITQ